jgi:hypothetical protein
MAVAADATYTTGAERFVDGGLIVGHLGSGAFNDLLKRRKPAVGE